MADLKTLRKENLKLQEDLAAVNEEVQNLKTLLKQQRLQSEIECVGKPTKTYCYVKILKIHYQDSC